PSYQSAAEGADVPGAEGRQRRRAVARPEQPPAQLGLEGGARRPAAGPPHPWATGARREGADGPGLEGRLAGHAAVEVEKAALHETLHPWKRRERVHSREPLLPG